MKELSIEQKAKRYDEAYKVADGIHRFSSDLAEIKRIEQIFPELKESEDEKIRKELIEHIKANKCADYVLFKKFSPDDVIAWLEKQGENTYNKELSELLHKVICRFIDDPNIPYTEREKVSMEIIPYVERLKKQGEKKVSYTTLVETGNGRINALITGELSTNGYDEQKSDKVEPKFKVGDWVIDKQGIVHQIANVVENVTNHTYGYDIVGGGYFNDNTEGVRLWTIEDAKEGDVLVDVYENIGIYQQHDDFDWTSYCSLGFHGGFQNFKVEHENDKTHPATKEQRDQLEKAMKEEGYVWDAEKKELSPVKLKAGQVLKHDNLSILCLGGRNAVKCNGEHFVIQYPDEWIEVYGEEYDKFFTRLQSSGYYYDFLHNQVKENCNTLWIARDFDGALAVFTNKPVLTKSKNRWIDLTDKNDFFSILPEYYYPKVTFENSPLQLFHL